MTKKDFFCNGCWKTKHIKELAFRFDGGKKAKCNECKKALEANDKPETTDKEVKEKNKKISILDSKYVKKRQEMEAIKDLLRLEKQYSYKLEDLV